MPAKVSGNRLPHGRAKAILFHPQSRPIQDAFMTGVNEVVSGTKSAKDATTAAAARANAAIRG